MAGNAGAMKLPRQVTEQADLAEEFMAAVNGVTGGDTNPDKGSDPAGEPAEGEAAGGDPTPQGEPGVDPPEKPVNWEARYKTLQGKFDAEVPRLHDELRNLKSKIVDGLLTGRETAVVPAPVVDADDTEINNLLETGRNAFGQDLIDFVDDLILRRSKVVARSEVQPINERMTSAEEAQLEKERGNFATAMNSLVPEGMDWHELMTGGDPDFQAFLDSEDPSGMFTYREAMIKANNNWNPNLLAKIFTIYAGATAPAPKEEPPKVDPPKADPQKAALDASRVAPARSTPVAESTGDEPRIWTPAMIREFEKNDRMGKYDKATSDAMWKDLLAAPGENRVQR